ncbi:MAG: helix-turn-helix domain-containing protein [Deltaproteobacteria bacterium]|nr:helix-turn-helix domain-containing protein [Deltaproteobacteria bacterium]
MKSKFLAKQVGQAIARQRKLARLTQAQVAEKLGIENETLSRIETGARPASLSRLEQLSDLFGCPAFRFFEQENQSEDKALLQSLGDILQRLTPEEQKLLVNYMIDTAKLFRSKS